MHILFHVTYAKKHLVVDFVETSVLWVIKAVQLISLDSIVPHGLMIKIHVTSTDANLLENVTNAH